MKSIYTSVSYPITRLPMILDDDCDYLGKPIKLNKYQIVSVYSQFKVS